MFANLYVLCLYISMLCYFHYIFTGIGPVTMTFMLLLVLELHDHNFLNTAEFMLLLMSQFVYNSASFANNLFCFSFLWTKAAFIAECQI